ncbi:MAG: sirohydrochlorin cobaltochelatase [Deltaproteobacteria bacterium]|jgi:sirohydrochlorin cobaltochelatase|nr:sirohydrochlorin cobaltochelatase [Deltaproteobacteria bacterium]
MGILSFFNRLLSPKKALAYERPKLTPAIVLAAFGSTRPEALLALENIEAKVRAAFEGYEVRLAFTSNQIRAIWRARGADPEYRQKRPEIPARYYQPRNFLSQLAYLQEAGGRLILAQPLLMADGEEFRDLYNLVEALKSFKTRQRSLHPFPWLALGPPALGLGDDDQAALTRAAKALSPIALLAAQKEGTVVMMAHGHETLELKVFRALEVKARELYGPKFVIGLVEGQPDFGEVLDAVAKVASKGSFLLLAPLMLVAGDHAQNDLASDDGWAGQFRRLGYNVEVLSRGLGSSDLWADIYVDNLKKLAEEVIKAKNLEEAVEEREKAKKHD